MRSVRIPEREIQICARAGFLTKEIWKEFVYRGKTERGANKAWRKQTESGLFLAHPNRRIRNVHILNRGHRSVQARACGNLARTPHESQLLHDEILLRGVLQAETHGFLEHWTLEAEMKAMGRESFQIRSQEDLIKYPDAIMHLHRPVAPLLVAIELELTHKNQRRYCQTFSRYGAMTEVSLVLFVTATPTIENAISRAMNESLYSEHGLQIGFMKLPDWKANPILANMRVGDECMTFGAWATQHELKAA